MNSVVQIQSGEYLSIAHVLMISTAVTFKKICVLLGFKMFPTEKSLCASRALNIGFSSIASSVEKTNECVAFYPKVIQRICVP
jgi:hypothetical protein